MKARAVGDLERSPEGFGLKAFAQPQDAPQYIFEIAALEDFQLHGQ